MVHSLHSSLVHVDTHIQTAVICNNKMAASVCVCVCIVCACANLQDPFHSRLTENLLT